MTGVQTCALPIFDLDDAVYLGWLLFRWVAVRARKLRVGGNCHRLVVSIAHDLSDGGLAVALVEMALAGNFGAKLTQLPEGPSHAALFGEDQGRYLIAVAPEIVKTILDAARLEKINIQEIGATGGLEISWPGAQPISLTELQEAFEKPLPAYMAGDDQAFA